MQVCAPYVQTEKKKMIHLKLSFYIYAFEQKYQQYNPDLDCWKQIVQRTKQLSH